VLRALAHVNPVTYVVDLTRTALGQPTEFAVARSVLVLAATVVLAFALTALVFDPERRFTARAKRP
jgi:hypothetical protein